MKCSHKQIALLQKPWKSPDFMMPHISTKPLNSTQEKVRRNASRNQSKRDSGNPDINALAMNADKIPTAIPATTSLGKCT